MNRGVKQICRRVPLQGSFKGYPRGFSQGDPLTGSTRGGGALIMLVGFIWSPFTWVYKESSVHIFFLSEGLGSVNVPHANKFNHETCKK